MLGRSNAINSEESFIVGHNSYYLINVSESKSRNRASTGEEVKDHTHEK